ncbi:energy transducer TonB [candidate division KSB1 bacterium]|nr:energy transducer TonB [candidate division KSB1 bacterium]
MISKSLGNECDSVAVAAIRATKWNPAKQKSKPVRTWVGIPVVFGIDKKNNSNGK